LHVHRIEIGEAVKVIACISATFVLALGSGFAAAPDASAATLKQRVAALEKKSKNLTKRFNTLEACLSYLVVPLTSYGDLGGTAGYVFDNDGDAGNAPFYTSALDFTTEGDTVHVWVPGLDPACVESGALRFRTTLERAPRSVMRHA
jgi:hypothetical protein